jgi:hypothetical protein
VVDYYLPANVSEVKLEILDARSNVIRSYQSSSAPRSPQPATDPEAYNKICQQKPSASDCGLPLYWPAPPQVLKTSAGEHRFLWDMHYDVVPGTVGGRPGGDDEAGAVPHRTMPEIDAPWAPPGSYTVRLTADGQDRSQPLSLLLDPRVKITPPVEQIFALTKQVEDAARKASKARSEAEAAMSKLQADGSSNGSQSLIEQLMALAPPVDSKTNASETAEAGFRPGMSTPSSPATLTNISGRLITSVMSMQGSEMPPTDLQLSACRTQLAAYASLMTRWTVLRAKL